MFDKIKSYASRAVQFVKKAALAVAGAVGVAAATAAPSHAALTVPAVDLTDMYTAVGVLLTALTAIWIVYKVIGFFKGK